ncbi:MAG: LysR substrate-binding domain-containing protein [Gammaproteobacteria bacterium]
MHELPLNALRAFAAVYETGGVRPAARRLRVTHSAVSRHLRELESWLGTALFEQRDGNRMLVFTPQGEALARTGLVSLRMLANAVKAARETSRRNAVTLSTTPSFAARWLLPRLPAFQRGYPGIELSVIAEQKLVDPAAQGAEIAIRMGKGPWPALDCEPLMDDSLYPVMSRALWEASDRPADPSSLKHLRLLHDRDPNASWASWLSVHGPRDIDTGAGPRFASSDLVLRAAAQGLGVALARHRLAADDITAGALVRPFGDLRVELPTAYWIVRPPGAVDSMAVTSVIEWLKSQATSKRASVEIGIGESMP